MALERNYRTAVMGGGRPVRRLSCIRRGASDKITWCDFGDYNGQSWLTVCKNVNKQLESAGFRSPTDINLSCWRVT